jgi:pimeloyl-ACP methyl ester carboxylesterase
MPQVKSGYAPVDNARIYYETAGSGAPFVMIHAGVADSRQWNNEFPYFAQKYQAVRFDMRGFGKSEPAEGEYSNLGVLAGLLDHLKLQEPVILIGCSMGGGTAMDFALANPGRVRALIMVASGPSGLDLDVEGWDEAFAEAEAAYKEGDLDKVAELETHIWFDGLGRKPADVDQQMRRLAYEMNRRALELGERKLGKRVKDAETPAAERLSELAIPVLAVVGEHDEPYALAAAGHMAAHLPNCRKAFVKDAAHLLNMDHPDEFRAIVEGFLAEVGDGAL